jgi:transcriptional regulator with XRE-family HTH domain
MASHLSEKIKYQIALKGMTITEFAATHNIVRTHIDNILYDRSKNPEIIVQIAEALGLQIEYLLHTKDEKASEYIREKELEKLKPFQEFNLSLFKETVIAISDICENENIDITQKKFYECLEEVYSYAMKNDFSVSQLKSFVEGLLHYSIKIGRVKKKVNANKALQ